MKSREFEIGVVGRHAGAAARAGCAHERPVVLDGGWIVERGRG